MAVFDQADPAHVDRVDFRLIQEGVALFVEKQLLDDVCLWFKSHGYLIYHFHCQKWLSLNDFYEDVIEKLDIPPYYGRNLDAFHDYLVDLSIPLQGGVVFVFWHYEKFAKRFPAASNDILDILKNWSDRVLLYAQIFMTLVHSDNPDYRTPKLGGWPLVQPLLRKNRKPIIVP